MAFDARETFKDDIEKLDEVNGSRIVPDGAPDIYNAVTSYLDKIARQIEENKDNPDKLKELQSLALSITETYFANTGENGGNNDIANLSEYMQAKLKTILGENSTAESKYPELTAKIKEITTPEPVKEPEIISLQANAEAHAQYQSLTGNEARRQFVADEFKSGKFSDPSHIDFFLEQYSKDEILINSEEDKKKLEALLDGIESYKGLEAKTQDLSDRIVKSSLTQTVLKPGMSVPPGTIPTPDMMETRSLDLGLADTLKKIDKTGKKDDVYQLIDEANKEAVRRRYEGNNPDSHGDPFKELSPIGQRIQKAQAETKWYQFKRKRELRKSLKGLMEEGYWETKVNLNSTKTSLGWHDFRKWVAGDRTQNFEKNVQKLNDVIELRTQDASMRWMSTNFWNKFKTKTSLLFKKSPEKRIEKLLKNADKAKIEELMADLNNRLGSLPEPTTKLESRARATQQGLLEGALKTIGDYPKTLDKQKAEAFNALQPHKTKAGQQAEKFKKDLEAHVTHLRENAAKALQKDPQYLAYVKLHGEKAAKEKFNVEKTITTDKVMDEILKAQGYSAEEIKEIKQKLGMDKEPEDKPAQKEDKTEEQTEEKQEEKPVREIHLDSAAREGSKPDEKYAQTEDSKLLKSEDGSRYDFITTDKDGNPRDPKPEEIEKMVASLPKDAKITLEDSFSAGTQEAILKEMEKQGIAIEDLEGTKKRIEERKQKEQEEAEKLTNTDENSGNPTSEEKNDKTASKKKQTDGSEKNAEQDRKEPSLEKVSKYFQGLPAGQKCEVKFKDLSLEEQKIARQMHAVRMNAIKAAKTKGLDEKGTSALIEQASVSYLRGVVAKRTQGKKPTRKQNTQINTVSQAVAMNRSAKTQ